MSPQTPVVLHGSAQKIAGSSLTPTRMAEPLSSDVTVALDLPHTVISDNQVLATHVLSSFENGGDVQAATGVDTPDQAQLAMLILEDALRRSAWQHIGNGSHNAAMSLLAWLL